MHILWLKTELLHPIDKGGKIRTYNMLRELKRKHRVTYVALDDGSAAPAAAELASEYCSDLVRIPFRTAAKRSARFYGELIGNVFSRLPYAAAKYRSKAMEQALVRVASGAEVDLVVCDFLAPSLNVPDTIAARAVLFQHNVEATIWRRHAEVARGALARRYFGEQARRMARHEARECARFGMVVAVSPDDRDAIRDAYCIDAIADVATGVDTTFFAAAPPDEAEPRHLVFTGSMDWLPNEDGITWLVDEVLPRIRGTFPDVKLTVVGRSPPPRVRALSEADPCVVVTGTVPDVRPYVARGSVFVVPLRIGGGTRLKIFEAMAMHRCVISTTVGAEGLPVQDGVHLLIADGAEGFANACIEAFRRPDKAAKLAEAAGELVRTEFGWDRIADQFARICAPLTPGGQAGVAISS